MTERDMYDIIVVGAGTAGMTAAIYALRAGKSVLLLEKGSCGGQIINTPAIDNYPGLPGISGYEYAERLHQQVMALGAELHFEEATAIRTAVGEKQVETAKAVYSCRTVILATGARNRHLGLPQEEELLGRGLSYCAACDGMFFRKQTVAVVGGGNTALEDALYLANLCEKVYLIHRREGFRGEARLLEQVREKENIELILNTVVAALESDAQGLTGLRLRNTVKETEESLLVQGLFVAIGQEPDTVAFSELVELDPQGYIAASEDCRTGTPGIFAAGDCRTKAVRQLTTAAADGAVAGLLSAGLSAN